MENGQKSRTERIAEAAMPLLTVLGALEGEKEEARYGLWFKVPAADAAERFTALAEGARKQAEGLESGEIKVRLAVPIDPLAVAQRMARMAQRRAAAGPVTRLGDEVDDGIDSEQEAQAEAARQAAIEEAEKQERARQAAALRKQAEVFVWMAAHVEQGATFHMQRDDVLRDLFGIRTDYDGMMIQGVK